MLCCHVLNYEMYNSNCQNTLPASILWVILRHQIIHLTTSLGVSELASDRTNELAQWSARAKRAVRSKRLSERCERTSEWTIPDCSEQLCSPYPPPIDRADLRGAVFVVGGGGVGGQSLDSWHHLHHQRHHSNPDFAYAQSRKHSSQVVKSLLLFLHANFRS